MRVQIAKGKHAEELVMFFKKKGYSVKLSKYKSTHCFRFVKFRYEHEKVFFALTYGSSGSDFATEFENATGLDCRTDTDWW